MICVVPQFLWAHHHQQQWIRESLAPRSGQFFSPAVFRVIKCRVQCSGLPSPCSCSFLAWCALRIPCGGGVERWVVRKWEQAEEFRKRAHTLKLNHNCPRFWFIFPPSFAHNYWSAICVDCRLDIQFYCPQTANDCIHHHLPNIVLSIAICMYLWPQFPGEIFVPTSTDRNYRQRGLVNYKFTIRGPILHIVWLCGTKKITQFSSLKGTQFKSKQWVILEESFKSLQFKLNSHNLFRWLISCLLSPD